MGADLQLGQGWLVQLDLLPGFYGSNEEFSGNDFNIPVNLGASYFVSADLQLIAGLSLDINRQYPLLPAVGVRWKLSHDWVLNAILPAPRFEYTFNPSLTFFAGADFRGDTFRVDDIAGSAHRSRRLNNAIVDYTQIRVGGGTTWTIAPHVTLEFEAGVVPIQDFDYHRANTRVRSKETPPYAGLSLKADF